MVKGYLTKETLAKFLDTKFAFLKETEVKRGTRNECLNGIGVLTKGTLAKFSGSVPRRKPETMDSSLRN